MSLPSDPRQLMINPMYQLLTALLALNVSAEIINVFFFGRQGTCGRPVPVVGGKAKYALKHSKTVTNSYKVDITLTNLVTGIRKTYLNTFQYEVGECSVANNAFIVKNTGSNFNGKAIDLKNAAKNGDKYFFSEIKAKCPGDQH